MKTATHGGIKPISVLIHEETHSVLQGLPQRTRLPLSRARSVTSNNFSGWDRWINLGGCCGSDCVKMWWFWNKAFLNAANASGGTESDEMGVGGKELLALATKAIHTNGKAVVQHANLPIFQCLFVVINSTGMTSKTTLNANLKRKGMHIKV